MTTMSNRAFGANVLSAPLDPWPLDPAQVLEGDPKASGTVLWRSADERLAVGIWHCTAGSFSWDHVDETLVVIEGRATVSPEDGSDPVELAPGVVAFFPEGMRTRWTVHETLRKG